MKTIRSWGFAAAVAAMMLIPVGARADVQKCQNKLETEVAYLQGKIFTAMKTCKDAIRKEVNTGVLTGLGTRCGEGKCAGGTNAGNSCRGNDQCPSSTCTITAGGGCLAAAAKTCETALGAVYGAGPVFSAKAASAIAVRKFRKDIEALRNGKCTASGNNGTPCHSNAECTTNGTHVRSNAECLGPGLPVGNSCCKGVGTGTCPAPTCSATCNDEDLAIDLTQAGNRLGHLLSGSPSGVTPFINLAPPSAAACPVGGQDTDGDGKKDPNCAATFMTDFLMFAIEKYAIKTQLMNVPDMFALFQDVGSPGTELEFAL